MRVVTRASQWRAKWLISAQALVGGAHMDSRHRRGMGGSLSVEREAKTSGVPFVALLRGRQAWAPLLDELKPVNSLLGLGASAAVMAAFVAT